MKFDIIPIACEYAWSLLHKPYTWGGDDPMGGLDCSGLCVEILQSVGIIERNEDYSSRGLAEKFEKVNKPQTGCLVFFTDDSNNINHVEFCFNETLSIGASGGGSKTLTLEDAIKSNAFVKLRPIQRDRHIWGYVDPFKECR